jgi:hypothetical protein
MKALSREAHHQRKFFVIQQYCGKLERHMARTSPIGLKSRDETREIEIGTSSCEVM